MHSTLLSDERNISAYGRMPPQVRWNRGVNPEPLLLKPGSQQCLSSQGQLLVTHSGKSIHPVTPTHTWRRTEGGRLTSPAFPPFFLARLGSLKRVVAVSGTQGSFISRQREASL